MLHSDSDYPFDIFKLFLYNYICVCKLISLKTNQNCVAIDQYDMHIWII